MREVIESSLEKLLIDHVSPDRVLAAEESGWSRSLWDLLDESGFALAASPESLGGAGAGWDDLFGVMQLCGRYVLPLPLPEAILANWLLGVCGLEPREGSLSFASANDLSRNGASVSGTVKQIPWGRHVARIVAIVEEDSPTIVVLDTTQANRKNLTLNTAGEPRDDLIFNKQAPIVTAPLADGLDARVLQVGGAMIRSAQIAGALEALLGISSEFVNERVQFGRPIGKFQVVQHQLAVLAEHVAAARVSAQAAFAESSSDLATLQIMAAKICCTESASIGASVAHGVHGAIGFTHEHPLHLITRRLWSWRSEFGTATYWSDILGRSVCKAGADDYWPSITNGVLR